MKSNKTYQIFLMTFHGIVKIKLIGLVIEYDLYFRGIGQVHFQSSRDGAQKRLRVHYIIDIVK